MSRRCDVVVVIPARMGSTRLPGKPLVKIAGVEMIVRVVGQALKARGVSRVVVATDDPRVVSVVEGAGHADVVMTPSDCLNGTDRCRRALELLGLEPEIVINLQGDEPMTPPEWIEALIEALRADPSAGVATVACHFEGSYEELALASRVKTMVTEAGVAMTFSRSVVPYLRGVEREEWPRRYDYLIHQGLYGFRGSTLERLDLTPTSASAAESLEQMAWLQRGERIRVVTMAQSPYPGVDTPEDVSLIERLLEGEKTD